jgi:hypothetical protein
MSASSNRPSLWVVLAALLLAATVAATVSDLAFKLGGLVLGYRSSITLEGVGYAAVPFGIVFLLLGGPVIVLFRKRLPFGSIACSTFGAACGALVGWMALPLFRPDQNDVAERCSEWFVIGMGSMAGLAGGMTFWLICRAASCRPAP